MLSSRSTPATAGSDFGVSSDGDNEEDDGDVDGVEQGDAVSSTDAEALRGEGRNWRFSGKIPSCAREKEEDVVSTKRMVHYIT